MLPWEEIDPNIEILFVENEDDLDELIISKETSYGDCGYTSYPFIYEVNFLFSELRAKQLLEYLKENLSEGQILELWKVWIGLEDDEVNIPYTRCRHEELTLNHLIQLYNWKNEKYKAQDCLVIKR